MRNTPAPNILLVEDDAPTKDSVCGLLRSYGYHAQTSNNLHSTLDHISNTVYDLIVIDLQMEDRNGFAVMDHMKKNEIDSRVIVIAGEQSEKEVITAFKKGAFDCFTKPLAPDELIESTQKAIDSIKQQRKNKWMLNTILASRERYRSVVDRQKEYVLLLDKDYKISFINRTYADYLGSEPKELVGCRYKTLAQKSTHTLLFSTLDDVRAGSTAMTVAFQVLDTKGRKQWQEWDFSGISGNNGQVCEIHCVGRDITEQMIRTDKIDGKKEKFRQIAASTSDWLWEIDENNLYTYVSPVVFGLLGYRPEELIGKSPFDFMPANEAKRMKRIFQESKAVGKPFVNIENINLHKNGSKIALRTNGVPIFDPSGAVIGYRGIDRNVTVRKMAEESLSKRATCRKNLSIMDGRRSDRLIPICTSCKMVRDGNNSWNQIEDYMEDHFNFAFSRGICPECVKKWYPEVFVSEEMEG